MHRERHRHSDLCLQEWVNQSVSGSAHTEALEAALGPPSLLSRTQVRPLALPSDHLLALVRRAQVGDQLLTEGARRPEVVGWWVPQRLTST